MSIEIKVTPGRLDVLCTGPWTQADVLKCVEWIEENKRAHPDVRACLIDCRDAQFDIDTFGRFKIGEYAAGRLGGQNLRIALLASKNAINRMVENTAYNRGLAMFTTPDADAAELWLSRSLPEAK